MGKHYSPEYIVEEFKDYMEWLREENETNKLIKVPTWTGFAIWSNVSTRTFERYKHLPEYSEAMKEVKAYIEEYYIFVGMNKSNSRFIEYVMNNRLGDRWSNKQIVETKDTTLNLTNEERAIALEKAQQDLLRLQASVPMIEE